MKYEIQIIPQGEVATTNRDWEIAIVRTNALHGQITGLTNQIQTLEQKRWMTAVVLGGLLARMKAAAQHGEWGKLFGKTETCFRFDARTGRNYMKLYREVLKRARKLGTVDVALIESGRRDARTLKEIGKLSDADSLRQAYFDFGVVTPPKSHGFQASGNPDGRPAREKETDPEPESTDGMIAYQNQLCKALPRLGEYADMIKSPFLDFYQFSLILRDVYAIINNRTNHMLEGWRECGHMIREYALAEGVWTPENKLPDPPGDRRNYRHGRPSARWCWPIPPASGKRACLP